MTLTSIAACAVNTDLADRVTACASKEAWSSPTLSLTEFGVRLRTYPLEAVKIFMWPVALTYETAYETALTNNVVNPGKAVTVITDLNIRAVVRQAWPADIAPPIDMQPPVAGRVPLPLDASGTGTFSGSADITITS